MFLGDWQYLAVKKVGETGVGTHLGAAAREHATAPLYDRVDLPCCKYPALLLFLLEEQRESPDHLGDLRAGGKPTRIEVSVVTAFQDADGDTPFQRFNGPSLTAETPRSRKKQC